MLARHLSTIALGFLLLAAPLGCACSGRKSTEQKSISAQSATTVKGTVTYLERIALKDPEVTVTLVDLGAAADAKPLGTQTLTPKQGPPYPFVVNYVLGDIQREHLYGVTAEVKAGGKVVFRAAEPVRVLTQGAGTEVEIVVKRVAG